MARNFQMSLDELKGDARHKKDGQLNVRVEAELLKEFKEVCENKIKQDYSTVLRNMMRHACNVYGKAKEN